ncbi:pyridoxamine kinase [Liquorilactobacillus mali]|uniref:pyridoxamine kinase n=1 Tax=Liquorilactobacillus mali TaxID=1618 RepID=UPI0023504224|nr:pyridoxamine kinase [Liquorilactobacillus mali]MDC7952514.1 pyridoxamine kinase [Liquorilactobacillus mali]
MKKSILISQDLSCAGQVSMSVALPILGALGFSPTVLPTAILSTHTGGFGKNTYLDLSSEMEKIIAHWETVPLSFSAVYLGYLGKKPLDILLSNIDELATDSFLLLDPVMGDHGNLYRGFDLDYVHQMQHLVQKADLITPNVTEAQLLLDKECTTGALPSTAALNLVTELNEKYKNKQILLTGIPKTNGKIGIVGIDTISQEIWQLETAKIGLSFFGTGDIFASVLLGALLHGDTLKAAARMAMQFISNTIEKNMQFNRYDSRFGLDYSLELPVLLKQLN